MVRDDNSSESRRTTPAAVGWERVQEIFLEAADLSPSARAPFLDAACAGDAALRLEIESLLAADASGGKTLDAAIQSEAASLLEEPALKGTGLNAAAEIGQHVALVSGDMIGPYRIIGILGEGGMGTVYEAVRDDDQFRQRVAIKVLPMSARTESLRRRFLRERQILAELDHPNIARLFDGGAAADGSPYLVMERIDGEPLTAFAASRELSIRQRLELFRQVAGAVQYAHQRLIVHRDLKPGNILVTLGSDGRPVPKLLDFGIAKLLDDETGPDALTATGFSMMTPDYASPEQVQGRPVTAASDVYSLGAVLYELLTGTRPHRLRSYDPAEIADRICNRDVTPPSCTGGAALRGDLDTIVLKAMHKVPERRYNSAEQFSEDLHRYLEGLPVLARPDDARYRIGKFVRRHWAGLGATAAVIVTLAAGVAVSVYQARQAQYQARLAQERFELVRTLANRFLFDFHAEIEQLSGTTKAQQMVVNTAVEYLDKLSQTAGSDRALLQEMAEAYARLAKVQGAGGVSGQGRHEDALASQRRSVELYRRLAAIDPAKRLGLARSLADEAHIEENLLQRVDNLKHSQEAVKTLDALLAASPQDAKLRSECAIAYVRLSSALRGSGKLEEALAAILKAEDYTRATLGTGDDLQAKYRLAVAQQDEAEVRLASGDLENAIAILQSALLTVEEITAAAPRNRYYQYLRIFTLELLEEAYYSIEDISAGDPGRAAKVDRRVRDLVKEFLASDQADRNARMNMAMVQSEGALALTQLDPRQAVAYAQSALAQWDQARKSAPDDQFSASRRARTVMLLALSLLSAGRAEEAVTAAGEAAGTYRELLAKKPDGMRYQKTAVFALVVSGQALAAARRDAEARRVLEEAASLGEQMRVQEQAQLAHTIAATYAFDHLGEFWKSRGDLAQARQWFERSRQAWAARAEQTPAVQQRRQQSEEKLKGFRL